MPKKATGIEILDLFCAESIHKYIYIYILYIFICPWNTAARARETPQHVLLFAKRRSSSICLTGLSTSVPMQMNSNINVYNVTS